MLPSSARNPNTTPPRVNRLLLNPEGGNRDEEQDDERHQGDGPSLGVVDHEPEEVEVDLIGGLRVVEAHVAEMARER